MCDCIRRMNKRLEAAKKNTILDVPEVVNMKTGKFERMARVLISTVKADPKNRTPKATLLAAYCPMCGKRYGRATRPIPKNPTAIQKAADRLAGRS